MRTFIAIEISEELRQELSVLQQELKKSEADVKWVAPDNLHLTLKFLGDTEEGKIEAMKRLLNKIAGGQSSFTISFAQIGVFPKPDFPRVVWVGIEKGKDDLMRLATRIEEELFSLKFPKEKRPFSTHLTLGRVRSPQNKDKLKTMINNLEGFKASNAVGIDGFVLFRSQLTPQGSIYTALEKFTLLSNHSLR